MASCSRINLIVTKWIVSYTGFLGPVVREFDTRERAEQWANQAGVLGIAKITEKENNHEL